jgi:hypothetical protein
MNSCARCGKENGMGMSVALIGMWRSIWDLFGVPPNAGHRSGRASALRQNRELFLLSEKTGDRQDDHLRTMNR